MAPETNYESTRMVDAAAVASGGAAPPEIIAGYHLAERIGAGGYGEVWRAIGPGGLPKAVKILHGRYDGPTADSELRALQRMRDLRHPFLLNIERIEIAAGRLVIVTELTDQSLEDLYLDMRRQGHPGLARERLLRYFREAADALDFLSGRHGLQHLDVKPSNLLLQGDHIKVADFGLIKDLRGDDVSQIGGFTPLYAPPEVFTGQPSETSDQYSLAVMYQVLLTGEPPFAGRNAAQLMSQHLSSAPDLTALPAADRPAVARALSKNPRARFPSCNQFIDALQRRKGVTVAPQRDAVSAGAANSGGERDGSPFDRPVERAAVTAECIPLAPLAADAQEARYRPTLFLGVGGLGGQVLAGLRRRFNSRFGAESDLGALPLLLVDTDPQALAAVRDRNGTSSLREFETLLLPLSQPQYYRGEEQRSALGWLGRRWLFNMPRSQMVEGIRPLGRLALCEHQEILRNCLRRIIQDATDEAALTDTRNATRLPFQSGPLNIYLVASLDGGSGSGMALEMGYLLRALTTELPAAATTALLLHGLHARNQHAEIQTANAVACLQELRYFETPGLGYPGAANCGLPSYKRGPFDYTYVVNLGADLGDAEYGCEVDKVAEYLFRNAVTPAGAFFDACRKTSPATRPRALEAPTLRTFRVLTTHHCNRESLDIEAASLCCATVRHWRGRPATAEGNAAAAVAEPVGGVLPAEFPLRVEHWTALAGALLRGEVARKSESYFRGLWEQGSRRRASGGASELTLRDIERSCFSDAAELARSEPALAVPRLINQELTPLAQACHATIRTNAWAMIDRPGCRVSGTRDSLTCAARRLDEAAATLRALIGELAKDLEQVVEQTRSAGERGAEFGFREFSKAESTLYFQYCALRLYQCAYRCFQAFVHEIRSTIEQLTEEVNAFGGRLQDWEACLHGVLVGNTADGVDAIGEGAGQVRTPRLIAAPEAVVRAFDEQLGVTRKALPSRLSSNDAGARADLATALREEALRFLMNTPGGLQSHDNQGLAPLLAGAAKQQSAQLGWPGAGGGYRMLAALPDRSAISGGTQLEAAFGSCLTLQNDAQGSAFLCSEAEGLSVDSLIELLAAYHPHILEMAARIHTRVDVQW